MKKSVEIKNLPIISIIDGNQMGTVKDLIINPEKGSVDFLTVEQEDWQVSVKAIPFKKVAGIGEFAVMVENENAVIDLNEIPIANQLVNKKIRILDARVISRKGQLVGQASEYFINEESGDILGIKLNRSGEQEEILHADYVTTYGKDILIVEEKAADYFVNSADQLVKGAEDEAAAAVEEEVEIQGDENLQSLKQMQIELLTGKTVKENIYTPSGSLLIEAGTVLEEQQIEAAQNEGPSVFVKLSMSIEE